MSNLRTNLFIVALGLSLLGLVLVYSATYQEYGAQYLIVRGGHIFAGLVVFFVVSRIPYTAWKHLSPWIYAGAVMSLGLVLVPSIGTEVAGARRWLDLGITSVQPSEFANVAAVMVLSCALARRRPGAGLPVGPLAAVGLLFLLIVLEPDFSTSAMMLAGVAGTLWASEVRTGILLFLGGSGLAGLVVVMLAEPYRRERFMMFLDPWSAAEGAGYQVVQSMIAIQSGSLFGAGVGSGTSDDIVPEAQTDMIFTMVGEELGLIGMMVVIAAFAFLALAGYRIALSTPSVLGRCMAAGFTTMLAAQAAFNLGATMGMLPLSGMTLPFVSYGGSSLIVCFSVVGILYRISEDSERVREAKPERDEGGSSKERPAEDLPESPHRRRRDRGPRDTGAMRGG